MGEFYFNVFTGKFDYFESGNGKFVLIAGDTMTGTLTVNPSQDEGIIIQKDKRLVFDGA